jgi:hypothetical protein
MSHLVPIALGSQPTCFGSPLHDGLKGIMTHGEQPQIIFIASNPEIDAGEPRIAKFEGSFNRGEYRLRHISITSSGKVYAAIDIGDTTGSTAEGLYTRKQSVICEFSSLETLKHWIREGQQEMRPSLITLPKEQMWTQLLSNATTTTALSSDGRVYTWTSDPRYPKCLGRRPDDDSPSSIPALIPYLSETNITKIASGGYLTAALSDDGELFLWGQTCPGTDGSLKVLVSSPSSNQEEEDDQDEFIKTVKLGVDGNETRVTEVAIGSGHVLVASESIVGGKVQRTVWAAGQCENGQLGIGTTSEFLGEFTSIPELRHKEVVSLTAAGWSSWVVVRTD